MKNNAIKKAKNAMEVSYLVYRFIGLSVYGSPGANTSILSGLSTNSFNSSGSPLKGGKLGASTDPQ